MLQLHTFTLLFGLCRPLSSTEGECIRSARGLMVRSGSGTHTSAGGVIYTGEWLEDKVSIYCVEPCRWLYVLYVACSLSLFLSFFHRCMAEGPCSIPLGLFIKENSKTACTTAWEYTPSRTAVPTKVNFTRTGESIFDTF